MAGGEKSVCILDKESTISCYLFQKQEKKSAHLEMIICKFNQWYANLKVHISY